MLLILTILLFAYQVIVIQVGEYNFEFWCLINIQIIFNSQEANLIFTLINGTLLGIYLQILGFSTSLSKIWQRGLVFAITVVFYLVISMFIGLRLTFNVDFLIAKSFTTNTAETADFLLFNLVFFTAVYGLSFFSEGETK